MEKQDVSLIDEEVAVGSGYIEDKQPIRLKFSYAQAKDGPARFRAPGEALGFEDDTFGDNEKEVFLSKGPAMWLRVMPIINPQREWPTRELRRLAIEKSHLLPLIHPSGGYSYLRASDGEGMYRAKGDKTDTKAYEVDSATFAFKERFIPHCIEPSFGVDRTVLAVLCNAYTEDEMAGEKRVFLKLNPSVAPYKVAVFPLLKNKPELVKKAEEIFKMIKKAIPATNFDDNGNIGKRYRRQDEIGTPFCVTIDFDTIEKGAGVTVRDRDSGKQERVGEKELIERLKG